MKRKKPRINKYESRLGRGKIPAEEFVAELICQRIAEHIGRELLEVFPSGPFWLKHFRTQKRLAKKLLEKFPLLAILRALGSDAGRDVYSLRAQWLEPLIIEAAFPTLKPDLPREISAAPAPETQVKPVVRPGPPKSIINNPHLEMLRRIDAKHN